MLDLDRVDLGELCSALEDNSPEHAWWLDPVRGTLELRSEYRREVIDSVQPLLSHHFNLTVEIPLKAVVRGHSYAITPVSWRNRAAGDSKLRLQEMGSRYLFIVLMVFLEHHLSRGDYRRLDTMGEGARSRWRAGQPSATFHEGPVRQAVEQERERERE